MVAFSWVSKVRVVRRQRRAECCSSLSSPSFVFSPPAAACQVPSFWEAQERKEQKLKVWGVVYSSWYRNKQYGRLLRKFVPSRASSRLQLRLGKACDASATFAPALAIHALTTGICSSPNYACLGACYKRTTALRSKHSLNPTLDRFIVETLFKHTEVRTDARL